MLKIYGYLNLIVIAIVMLCHDYPGHRHWTVLHHLMRETAIESDCSYEKQPSNDGSVLAASADRMAKTIPTEICFNCPSISTTSFQMTAENYKRPPPYAGLHTRTRPVVHFAYPIPVIPSRSSLIQEKLSGNNHFKVGSIPSAKVLILHVLV